MNQLSTTQQDDALALIENPSPEALQAALAEGRLEKLSVPQRLQLLSAVCKSTGLNPLTRPFEFIALNGRIVLYARKDATDQLRKRDNVSLRIISRETVDGVYVVTAQATTPNGRMDESIGVVPCNKLAGEALANAIMKAEAKAKRRVTLSICGLGFMDETELDGARAGTFDNQPARAEPKMPQSADITVRADVPPVAEEEASAVVDIPAEAVTTTLDAHTLELLDIIAEADAKVLGDCVAEVKFLQADAAKEAVKQAIQSHAKELGVRWDKEKGAFV